MDRKLLLILLLSVFILNSIAVNAQDGVLDTLLSPLGDINFAETYQNSPYLIDAIIFSIIFISISMIGLGRVMPGRPGKTLAVVVGIALTVAFEVWSYSRDPPFTLQSFGPAAVLILMAAFGIAIYMLATYIPGLGGTNAGLISVVFSWYTFKSLSPGTYAWLAEQGGILKLIAGLADVAALIIVIMLMINAFKAIFGALGEGGNGTVVPTTKEEKEGKRESRLTGKRKMHELKMSKDVRDSLKDIEKMESAFTNKNEKRFRNYAISAAKKLSQIEKRDIPIIESISKEIKNMSQDLSSMERATLSFTLSMRDDLSGIIGELESFEKSEDLEFDSNAQGKIRHIRDFVEKIESEINSLIAMSEKIKEKDWLKDTKILI
ncbi:hypothetical protein GF336_01125 [Candidatus Woesearchaeota archaeon]|nr:hypothetical protein [Candidatus Woesearchaeota archaeon]